MRVGSHALRIVDRHWLNFGEFFFSSNRSAGRLTLADFFLRREARKIVN